MASVAQFLNITSWMTLNLRTFLGKEKFGKVLAAFGCHISNPFDVDFDRFSWSRLTKQPWNGKKQMSGMFNTKWNECVNELKEYKRIHGYCNVPQKHKQLGIWVCTQRKAYKNKTLSGERIAILGAMCFRW